MRELRALGYEGGYTILKDYVHPRRHRRQPMATVRFETKPGEQAQVDWGSLPYVSRDGKKRRKWAFVMVMGYLPRRLRRNRPQGRRGDFYRLSHKRLRLLWRDPQTLSL